MLYDDMMICKDCGYVFDAADENKFYIADYGEEIACCPNCRSDNLAWAKKCMLCHKYYDEDDIHFGACPHCLDDVEKRYRTMKAQNFNIDEREVVEARFEGEELND